MSSDSKPPTKSVHPDSQDDDAVDDSGDLDEDFAAIQRTMSQKRREGHEKGKGIQDVLPFPFAPNIRPLTTSDLQSCIALENAAFPEKKHRASPEKIEYRLTTCPELCLGVFCTVVPNQAKNFDIETLSTAGPVETVRPNRAKSVLLAHIISTATTSDIVTDQDMDYPQDWRDSKSKEAKIGHQEGGRTICVHSLAVSPKLQGCGLGKLIIKSFLQQMKNSGTADRVALICQDYLVSYYERFGFKHAGKSHAQFGGGGWHDMIFDLGSTET